MSRPVADHEREALTILMEECAEVVQACSKALRHGPNRDYRDTGHSNSDHIEFELSQVLFMVHVCVKLGIINHVPYISEPDEERARNFHHLGFVGHPELRSGDPVCLPQPQSWGVGLKRYG